MRSLMDADTYAEIGIDMISEQLTEADFQPRAVKRAKAWAEVNGWPWPPKENETDKRNRAAGYTLL